MRQLGQPGLACGHARPRECTPPRPRELYSRLKGAGRGASTQARVELFASASYELGEAEYAANEADDVWVQGLVASVETVTTFLQMYLTGSNYDAWVQLLMDHVVVRVEGVVLSKRFNQLGALQFERELRTLVASFAATTSHAVRDKFARLTQVGLRTAHRFRPPPSPRRALPP